MRPFIALCILLLSVACGVKAPPRPPEPESKPATDGGVPDGGPPAAPSSTCQQADGGCNR